MCVCPSGPGASDLRRSASRSTCQSSLAVELLQVLPAHRIIREYQYSSRRIAVQCQAAHLGNRGYPSKLCIQAFFLLLLHPAQIQVHQSLNRAASAASRAFRVYVFQVSLAAGVDPVFVGSVGVIFLRDHRIVSGHQYSQPSLLVVACPNGVGFGVLQLLASNCSGFVAFGAGSLDLSGSESLSLPCCVRGMT